jgi:site-specific recombinase XerC
VRLCGRAPRGGSLAAEDRASLLALVQPVAVEPLAAIKGLVLDSVSSPHTRRSYDLALSRFLAWYQAAGSPGLTKATVQRYRAVLEGQGLAASSLNVHLKAIRKLAAEGADNGLLAPEFAAGIGRVRGARRLGTRAGNWLTARRRPRRC